LRSGYTPERASMLYARLQEKLATIPGVAAVSSSAIPLLSGEHWGGGVRVEGVEHGANRPPSVLYNAVGAGFFDTVGMPLIAGRGFTEADIEGRPKVAVVNERFAEHFGLGRVPLGKRLGFGPERSLDIEIVGVVADAKYGGAKEEIEPQFFLPWRQFGSNGRMSYYLRSALPPEQLLGTIAKAVAAVDPALPLNDLRTMEQQVRAGTANDRSMAALAFGFAVLATALAAVGLYGVLSYTVAQRTRELGLRLALGAPPAGLRAMVLRQVASMAAIGSVLGLTVALLLGRAGRTLLFDVKPADPAACLAAAAVLIAVVLAAGYWPARRASRIDPMVALRCD
jgi:predicted permease